VDELILLVREALQIRVVEMRYPPYSSDLVAAGNSQVPEVKIVPKRRRFQDIKESITVELNTVPVDTYSDCFMKH
jgi:hypothetical protein